jgi:UDP-N-acetylglucosamine acyltransferase
MTNIHPTAIISPKAQIGENVSIGAYCIIEDDVIIGDDTQMKHHCVIGKRTIIGNKNIIHNSACLGVDPQDIKYKGEITNTIIGNENVIREFVTINNGTAESGCTIVGNNNYLLSYTHIAHDNRFGNNIIMSNAVQLAGHVKVEDNVVFGGLAAVHQFCVVGKYAMIGAGAILVKDAPPFALIDRVPAYHGVNKIGLARRGFSNETIRKLNDFYNLVFKSGYNNTDGINKYTEQNNNIIPEIQYCIDFILSSERGVLR